MLTKIINQFIYLMLLCLISTSSLAMESEENFSINNMNKANMINYTLLNPIQYEQTVQSSRLQIQALLTDLQIRSHQTADERIDFIVNRLLDIPYMAKGAMGEGDWQSNAASYQSGAVHINQDPVYRLDGLDCQTLVQVVMALLYSKDLNEFDQNILKISYGAAGNPNGEIVRYYNRNHFTDGDWNPINQHNGWLLDVTSQGPLSPHGQTTSADITRQQWFLQKQNDLLNNVRVLNDANGIAMVDRLMTTYSKLDYPKFDFEHVITSYLPKEKLAIKQPDGSYLPNQALLDSIPTPAVIEIVRDVKKWNINGKNIKDIIGSELSISHMGLLYRKDFKYGDLIYRKINCYLNDKQQKTCDVTPIFCEKESCSELMYAHATMAYPNNYYWYKQANGDYTCSSTAPSDGTRYTQCNRVEQQTLFSYLTSYQYGTYVNMSSPSIIGVHIEKLS